MDKSYAIANPNAMSGSGVGRVLRKIDRINDKISDWARRNQVVSGVNTAANVLGVSNALNSATGGAFGRAVDYGMSKGYGRKRRKTGGKKKGKGKK